MRREDGGEANDNDATDNNNRSGCGGGLPCCSHLTSLIVGLFDWIRGSQGNSWWVAGGILSTKHDAGHFCMTGKRPG